MTSAEMDTASQMTQTVPTYLHMTPHESMTIIASYSRTRTRTRTSTGTRTSTSTSGIGLAAAVKYASPLHPRRFK